MAEVVLKNLVKTYTEGETVVHGINLTIQDGEFMVFVGPSGCAKSTTLRMIAGLEDITGGEVLIDGKVVNRLAPKDRGIAMVFQNYALYPHMTVFENMAFGLTLAKMDKVSIAARVREAAEKLEITNLLDRRPKDMSGGQRQRVAVGRAIVRKPAVFLFDEPLSNLDAKLRVSMRLRITQLHKELKQEGQNATMIYVTHDQVEAMTMGDRICVLNAGRIMQVDTPLNLYNKPANKFVAGFIGSPAMNLLEATLTEQDNRIGVILHNKWLALPEERANIVRQHVGKKVWLGLRPESIGNKNSMTCTPENTLRGVVKAVEQMGNEEFVYFAIGKEQYTARIQVEAAESLEFGSECDFGFDLQKAHIFDFETEQNIGLES
ncbi:ABC transporter ATP-binding protein [Thorsellia anophelis]|uniref:Multiple sugar transport system ATP-binding protein n=1 Tax=Thorsellia anophelis DSM 18579 TaxID=1123402 RepID=A0A1I0DZ16_9GAMM|nr:sn-glycerol-3-phosphate ABC transporter ATP-binding protein UgpC [Thorsellia anophelis]SET37814.1 multiple sugar transport system ATP-binding protein [Thorsellia anophelis DSM 18579]